MNATQIIPLALKIVECENVQEKLRLFNSCDPKFTGLLHSNIEALTVRRQFLKQQAQQEKQLKLDRKTPKLHFINSANAIGSKNSSRVSSSTVSTHYLSVIRKTLTSKSPNNSSAGKPYA
jgi:hypothetical protein